MIEYTTLLARLFFEFFKTGLFAVGGGMATIPFLTDMATRTGWFTHAQLADMIAVAESTPGPIGVNTATYVGFTVGGIPGGIIATLGLVSPSVIIIIAIFKIIEQFRENRFVKCSFYFLRPASMALLFSSLIVLVTMSFFKLGKPASIDNISLSAVLMALSILVLTNFVKPTKKLHPIIWIFIGAVSGVFLLR